MIKNGSNGVIPDQEELIAMRLQARDLPLTIQKSAKSDMSGSHRSAFRGRGMDYEESRGYQPGDDIRNMDWRITARSGQPHVKVYHEERERPVIVMADFGPRMFFATEGVFKSIIATRIAAMIAWAAIHNGDRIGALLFNHKHHELRPLSGKHGALRLIRELIQAADPVHMHNPARQQDNAFNDALVRLQRVTRPGSLVYIVSDFYQLDNNSKRHLQQLRRHNDVIACQVLDRIELQAPAPGRYPVSYGGQQGILDTTSKIKRDTWELHFSQRRQLVREMMQQSAIPLLKFSTADHVSERLCEYLTQSKYKATYKKTKQVAA